MRSSLAILILVTLAACGTSNTTRPEGYHVGSRPLLEAKVEARSIPTWVNPKTLQLNPATIAPESDDMVIRGIAYGYEFSAGSDIEGTIQAPPVPGRCEGVYLVLRDRRLVSVDDPAPQEDHLVGAWDPETELFYPSSRQIVRVTPPEIVEVEDDQQDES